MTGWGGWGPASRPIRGAMGNAFGALVSGWKSDILFFNKLKSVRGKVIHGRHFFKIKHGQKTHYFNSVSKEEELVIYWWGESTGESQKICSRCNR